MQYTAGSLTEQVSFILSLFSQEKTAKGDGFPKSVSIYWRLYFPKGGEKAFAILLRHIWAIDLNMISRI